MRGLVSVTGYRRATGPLYLDAATWHLLLEQLGPSLALWRAAEVAVLRRCRYERPILDLGCGDGLITSLVLPRVDIGLDPWEQALAQADRRGLYERLVAAAAEKAPLRAGSLATILSNSVLEHLPQLDEVLFQCARLLRPGGRLLFTVPTEAFSRWLLLPGTRYAGWRNRQLEHRNLWSVERWARHLEQAGLEIEEVHPYLRPSLVRAWDTLELLQQVWIGRRRLLGVLWRALPAAGLESLARRVTHLDLSASPPGGGRLIVSRKR